MFDKLVLLSDGQVMFFGDAPQIVPYLAQRGYSCPPSFNPADYFIDLVSIDARTPVRLFKFFSISLN